ncbi:MAG TPA: Calx-beta domain-containing protein [Urbifossiella sp.]|nr:Calx-beta domain-containing protein [Urbifossiella sp.]
MTVTLSQASAQTVTVHYQTADGTATAWSDYTPASGTLTFAPGQTAASFSVPIIDDGLIESDETVGLSLSMPSGAVLGAPAAATLTIHDNDALPPSVAFASTAYSVPEPAGSAVVTVTLSAAATQTVTVAYWTFPGTATAGADYTPVSGTLTFAPGQTAAVFTVPIIDDTLVEGDETVQLVLVS